MSSVVSPSGRLLSAHRPPSSVVRLLPSVVRGLPWQQQPLPRRHPVMPPARSNATSFSAVDTFPTERIRAI